MSFVALSASTGLAIGRYFCAPLGRSVNPSRLWGVEGAFGDRAAMRCLTRRLGALVGVTLLSLAALTMTLTMTSSPAGAGLPLAAEQPSVPILGQVALKSDYATAGRVRGRHHDRMRAAPDVKA